jgi:exosome complex RNA-binding protein Csl4
MLHAYLAALALATTALAASGCGGSSSKTASTAAAASSGITTQASTQTAAKTESGKQLTSAQLIAAGDVICARLNAQLEATHIRANRELAVVLPQAAAHEQAAAAELAGLVPPTTMARDWQLVVTEMRRASEDSVKLGDYVRTKNIRTGKGTPLVAEINVALQRVGRTARRDGFKQCSKEA